MRIGFRPASRASSVSGSTRYQGRCPRSRHARCSKRSCANTSWLSTSARRAAGSRVLTDLHTLRARCHFSPLLGASRRRAAPGNQVVEGAARLLRVRSSVLKPRLASRRSAFRYAPQLAQQHCSAMNRIRESSTEVSSECSPDRRPNPSVERTSNGGARCHAPSRSVAPLAAAHLER